MVCMAMMMSTQANAQLGNILKNAAGSLLGGSSTSETAVGAVTDIVGNLLGKNKVTESNLTGTWTYSEPCVVFESENVLTQLGSTAVSSKIENTMSAQLTKIGFTKGKVVLTLNEGGKGVVTFNGKSVNVEWAVSGNTLILTYPMMQKSVSMNVNMTGGNLQVAMNAEKLLTFITGMSEKVSVTSTLQSISAMIKNVKGLYLGLKFTK